MTTYNFKERIAMKILKGKLDEIFEDRLAELCIKYDKEYGNYPKHPFEGMALFKAYKEDDFRDTMKRDIYGPSVYGPKVKEYAAQWGGYGVIFE